MLNLFIHKFEVVFELLKEGYILVKWGVCNVIIVHLIKEKMKQVDIQYWSNLFYFQSLIQLSIIFRKFRNN
jgi:hypothetical protein